MHTYRASSTRDGKFGFQVGSNTGPNAFDAVGPICEKESEAAALASYLNGGEYDPSAVAAVYKPSEEAREKARKQQEDRAKREEEAEKARQKAAQPPHPEQSSQADAATAEVDANEDVEAVQTQKANRRHPPAHASKAKQHVKRGKVRKHK